jgi:hypothetical protein
MTKSIFQVIREGYGLTRRGRGDIAKAIYCLHKNALFLSTYYYILSTI